MLKSNCVSFILCKAKSKIHESDIVFFSSTQTNLRRVLRLSGCFWRHGKFPLSRNSVGTDEIYLKYALRCSNQNARVHKFQWIIQFFSTYTKYVNKYKFNVTRKTNRKYLLVCII